MASPSVIKQWTMSRTPGSEARRSSRGSMEIAEPTPRRSPRLSNRPSTGGRSALSVTSANKKIAKKSPARRSSLLVGGKRSLEPRASPSPAEDELPEEMKFETDSPAQKKARPSDAKRQSRVSFIGVELCEYDPRKSGILPAEKSPKPAAKSPEVYATEVSTVTEVSEASMVSNSSNEEGFYSPSRDSEDDVTEKVPSLRDLIAEEDTDIHGYTANLTANLNSGEETVAVKRLSDLGNFDHTEKIQTRTSSMGSAQSRTSSIGSIGLRESMAPNTDVIAANMLSRESMAPQAMGLGNTPTASGPSLTNLIKRRQGELDDSQATNSVQDTSSPNASEDDLDGSMEMTECYGGGIVQTAQSSPARPPVAVSPKLAAASMTTLNVKPPESPNLKKILREREREREHSIAGQNETTAAALLSSPAPNSPANDTSSRRMSSIGAKIPMNMNVSPIASSKPKARMSTTPLSMNRRKGASMLAATEGFAPPSPVSAAPQVASPAMMRAGSRATLTESGTKPSPNPPQSPCRPSQMVVSPAQAAAPTSLFDSNEEDACASGRTLTADQHADEVLGRFESEEQEEESLNESGHYQIASPVPVAQTCQSGETLKDELKRRSMAHAGQVPLAQAADTTRSRSSSKAICNNFRQFYAISDIDFLDNMSVNRRDTLCVRQGGNKAQDCGLGEAIARSTTACTELRVMQDACDKLTNMIDQSQTAVAKAENAAELSPPALFEELARDTRSEKATVIRGKLKTLKQTCRKRAKLQWYKWYHSIMSQVHQEAQGEITRLMKEESDLIARKGEYDDMEQKLHECMASLGLNHAVGQQCSYSDINEVKTLEKATLASRQEATALEDHVAKLRAQCVSLQDRKDTLQRSVDGLSFQKDFLMGESSATPVSLEDTMQAQQVYLEQLNIEGVVLRTMKYNEIVIDVCEAHRLILTMENEKIVEAQLKIFEAQDATSFGGEVDDFWRGLVEDAEVESIVMDLCGRDRNWIPHYMNELSLRLGRCHDLKDEVNSIRSSLKLLVERERGSVTVLVTNLPLQRKLSITFNGLGFGYPSAELDVDVKHHLGDVSAAAAMDVVNGFKTGQYGRLYSTCDALVQLVSSRVI